MPTWYINCRENLEMTCNLLLCIKIFQNKISSAEKLGLNVICLFLYFFYLLYQYISNNQVSLILLLYTNVVSNHVSYIILITSLLFIANVTFFEYKLLGYFPNLKLPCNTILYKKTKFSRFIIVYFMSHFLMHVNFVITQKAWFIRIVKIEIESNNNVDLMK